jgi:hypothetical protein
MNAFGIDLKRSLINCHVRGVDSLVINAGPPMVRLFVARANHELWKNHWDANSKFSLGLHPHHCDVTLIPIVGQIHNITFAEYADDPCVAQVKLSPWKWSSHIRGEGGKFTRIVNTPIPTALASSSRHTMSGPVPMAARQCHTIYVPHGKVAAWMVWEGAEDPGYESITWSNADLSQFETDELYQPMTESRLLADLDLAKILQRTDRVLEDFSV